LAFLGPIFGRRLACGSGGVASCTGDGEAGERLGLGSRLGSRLGSCLGSCLDTEPRLEFALELELGFGSENKSETKNTHRNDRNPRMAVKRISVVSTMV
jgi:hypothetical protein